MSRLTQRLLIVFFLACFVFVGVSKIPNMKGNQDVNTYKQIGNEVVNRFSPLQTIESQYPPLATSLFTVIRSVSLRTPFSYNWFSSISLAFVACIMYLWWRFSMKDALLFATCFTFVMLLLGSALTWERFDIFVAMMIFLTWRSLVHGKYAESVFWLVLAGGLKLIPFVSIPVLWLLIPHAKRSKFFIGLANGVLGLWLLPVLVLGNTGTWSNMSYFLQYHGSRGIQMETLWSGIDMMLKNIMGEKAELVLQALSWHNADFSSSLTLPLALFGLLGIVVIYKMLWKKRRSLRLTDSGLIIASPLLWTVSVGTILSPQYYWWFMPIILGWSIEQFSKKLFQPRTVIIGGISAAVLLLTQMVYPITYDALVNQQSFAISLLNMRNLLSLGLVGSIMYVALKDSPANSLRKRLLRVLSLGFLKN